MMSSASTLSRLSNGTHRFRQLRSRLIALGVLTLVAFCASTAYDSYRSYTHAVITTKRELTNVANALAEQTAWTVQTVDMLLQDTARWYRNDLPDIPPAQLDQVLANRTAGVRQVSLVTLVDEHGIQQHRSRGVTPPGLDVSDRSYFISQRDGSAHGLFMSEPLVTRSQNRAGIVLSRRLETEQGAFAGVVTAIVNLEDLKEFYTAVNLGPGGGIQLVQGGGGSLLMRIPDQPPMPAFVAEAAVRDTPLVVRVTRATNVALRPWRDETIRIGVRTVVLVILGIATLLALLRQLRRIEAGEAALRESEAQLRQSQKLEAIGTLAGGIAHDFNNILGAIMGYGEMAQRQCTPGSSQQRHLDNVMHAAGRAKTLVDRILGFSRSGLGERVLVNMQWIVEETIGMLEAALPPQIRLEKRLEASAAGVIGDATGLHQVIMNLCTNAQQAMSKGGVLTVALDLAVVLERRSVARGTLVAGKYVRLTVQDTGAGIPQAVYERMFDPFFTTKQVGEGTGLGLSLVHGIVTDLGGSIDVSTGEGRGTRFEIWLPDAGDAARPVDEVADDIPLGGGETVMIIDDEAALVSLSEEILAELGYEPVGFNSSPAALAAFRAEPDRFDAVLSDEAMPEMTGTELVRAVRQLRKDIPVVLMSGHADSALEERASQLGVSEVLHKPLQRRDLAGAMARIFRTSASRMES